MTIQLIEKPIQNAIPKNCWGLKRVTELVAKNTPMTGRVVAMPSRRTTARNSQRLHELEFREAISFTYVVLDSSGRYLDCCYLYPMGRRTNLSEDLLNYDVDVSWWVTPDAYARGYYQALRHWITADFPFRSPYFSNAEIPRD